MEVKAKFDHFNVNVNIFKSQYRILFEGIRFYRSS